MKIGQAHSTTFEGQRIAGTLDRDLGKGWFSLKPSTKLYGSGGGRVDFILVRAPWWQRLFKRKK